jgi:hypothetical protein
MSERVPYPTFELAGAPCEKPGCSGVLVDFINLKSQDFFRRCSVCGSEVHRVPAKDKLAWVERTIERALKGERSS